jgi:mannose/fructose/N-acetylgalactosamine-specific phosphotransferase system component IID
LGALFAAIALLGGLTGNTLVFLIATSFALGAAFLNAAFGFCLGCQFYLILLRAKSRITSRN